MRHLLQEKEHFVDVGFTIWDFTILGFNAKLQYMTFIDSGHDSIHLCAE